MLDLDDFKRFTSCNWWCVVLSGDFHIGGSNDDKRVDRHTKMRYNNKKDKHRDLHEESKNGKTTDRVKARRW